MDEQEKPKRKAPAAFIEAGKKHRWKPGTSGNSWRVPPEFESFAWQPGESGAGRPKYKTLSKLLQYCCDSVIPGDKQQRTFGQVIASYWVAMAARGNLRAIELVVNRLEGLPQSNVSLSGSVELPQGERITELAGRLRSLAEEKVQ